ncbi:hypothetical protein J1614_000694 [Plenodomus biglobosus]|nr:hypothetical protein J1614_000694 [Plenodomus biglobosus]
MSMIIPDACRWEGEHELYESDEPVHGMVSGLLWLFQATFDELLKDIGASFLVTSSLTKRQLAGLVTSVALGNPFHLISQPRAEFYFKEFSPLTTAMIKVQKEVEDASDFYRSTHDHTGLIDCMLLLARSLYYRAQDKPLFALPTILESAMGCDFHDRNLAGDAIAIAVRCTVLKAGATEVVKLYPKEWKPEPEERSERGITLMKLLKENSLPEYLDDQFDQQFRPAEWTMFKTLVGYLLNTRYHLQLDLDNVQCRLNLRAEATHPNSPQHPKRPTVQTFTIPYTQEAMAAEDPADRRCFVCFFDYGPDFSDDAQTEPAVKTKCGHVQGASCLEIQITEGSTTCALCRQPLFGLEHRLPEKAATAYLELMGLIAESEKLDEETDKYILEGCRDTHGPEFGVLLHKLADLAKRVSLAKCAFTYDGLWANY